ncbi:MAG TPA: nodulation protein NfeD [Solirubrobacterales bacterium]|nr:nodulation protein NfeD [Solirubrobacterales bacterium]
MRRLRLALSGLLVAAGLLGLAGGGAAQEEGNGVAYSIEIPGTIDPATQRWLGEALDDAADADADVAILRIDTPGGLDTSMREMVQDILAAPMPVIVYVTPNGARAASAGVFIVEAADVAAMAPQTNIGAASPVSLGGGDVDDVLGQKIENDAGAYVRALAEGHGRNGDLADQMVKEAVSVTASEAEARGLIDVIAPSERDLLDRLDGFEVQGPKAQRLETAGLVIEQHDMPLQYDLLQILVNPTVSYLLLIAGLVGLAIELFAGGGAIAPGVLGALSLLLGAYGTALLPVTLVGVVLIVAGVGLIVAEAHLPTHGILGAAGVGALVVSGLLLYDTDSEALGVSVPVVIAAGLLLGGFIAFAVQRAVLANRERPRTGWEELVGEVGEVRVPLAPVGQVFVEGALWRARPVDDGTTLDRGYRVRVESVDGLTLVVRPAGTEAAKTAEEAEEGAG